MKNLKNIFAFILAVIMSSSVAYAADSATMNQMDSIKVQRSIKELLKEAKESGQSQGKKFKLYNEYGVEYEGNVYEIDTTNITTYAASNGLKSVTIIASTDDINLVSRAVGGQITEPYWDETGSVEFFATLYYNTGKADNGNKTYLLTKVGGDVDFHSSACTVNKQTIDYGCTDLDKAKGQYSDPSNPYKPSSTTFTKNTGFNKYVQNIPGSWMGMYWEGQIVRGTSIWMFDVEHSLFGSMVTF